MLPVRRLPPDVDRSPLLVFYEVTRACDLVCLHCRACAQPQRDPEELASEQSRALIDDLASFERPPLLVFTGGDPLKRRDIFELVEHARQRGLETAMTPSATPLVTAEALRRLKDSGLHRLAVSLDGADAAVHDRFRGVSGSFERTLEIMAEARRIGLPLQVNTTVSRRNVHQLDALAELLAGRGIVLWSVFFLVPVGRGLAEQRLDSQECEAVFEKLHAHAARQPYAIKTTEAPHYRRFLMQHRSDDAAPSPAATYGTNDGKGICFVSHKGEICPSGFLPLAAGRFPTDSVVKTYQQSPLFRQLRNGNELKGKCGICEYRHLCGGSRARAYALSGEVMAEEPDCIYLPAAIRPAPALVPVPL